MAAMLSAALLAVAPVVVVIIIVVGIVIVILLIDGVAQWIQKIVTPTCSLIKSLVFPNYCSGTCPPGSTCTATTTRGYLFFGTQAATCGCVAPPAPPAPPGGTTGGTGTGSGGGGGDGG